MRAHDGFSRSASRPKEDAPTGLYEGKHIWWGRYKLVKASTAPRRRLQDAATQSASVGTKECPQASQSKLRGPRESDADEGDEDGRGSKERWREGEDGRGREGERGGREGRSAGGRGGMGGEGRGGEGRPPMENPKTPPRRERPRALSFPRLCNYRLIPKHVRDPLERNNTHTPHTRTHERRYTHTHTQTYKDLRRIDSTRCQRRSMLKHADHCKSPALGTRANALHERKQALGAALLLAQNGAQVLGEGRT